MIHTKGRLLMLLKWSALLHEGISLECRFIDLRLLRERTINCLRIFIFSLGRIVSCDFILPRINCVVVNR